MWRIVTLPKNRISNLIRREDLEMLLADYIEWTSVGLNLAFLILLMRKNRWCWPFGILGSGLGVYLFVSPETGVKLYSEAILYSYYVWIGIYGWTRWNRNKEAQFTIIRWGWKNHIGALVIGLAATPILGYVMDRFFSSNNPYVDAFTTVFSFIASYMQAEKVFSSWHFWIILNGVSIWLYWHRGLELYSLLMTVYFILSWVGLFQWAKEGKSAIAEG
jgi:nicotinamide mononucleotide transporter